MCFIGGEMMSKVSKSVKSKVSVKSCANGKKHANATECSSKIPGRVVIKYDVGFNNSLYIRGRGAGLSWDKGELLKNISADEWVWEPSVAFNECEFKVLINDASYEGGENHHLAPGAQLQYTPAF
jgi:hypothetical protein